MGVERWSVVCRLGCRWRHHWECRWLWVLGEAHLCAGRSCGLWDLRPSCLNLLRCSGGGWCGKLVVLIVLLPKDLRLAADQPDEMNMRQLGSVFPEIDGL